MPPSRTKRLAFLGERRQAHAAQVGRAGFEGVQRLLQSLDLAARRRPFDRARSEAANAASTSSIIEFEQRRPRQGCDVAQHARRQSAAAATASRRSDFGQRVQAPASA